MRRRLTKPLLRTLTALAPAAGALVAWAAWLGWDQRRDVAPDGTTTGPYAAWQVIGLVLTLLPPVYWATARHRAVSAVLGVPAGLAAAAFVDWSDDSSGLFVIGVGLVLAGGLAATAAASAVIGVAVRARAGGSRSAV